jgi:RIO kinase 1
MSVPDWLITEPDVYEEYDLGPLKAGKEAQVFVIERVLGDRSCLLAHKRYRPRSVTRKGQLEELGFQGSTSFVNDHAYRAHRRVANSHDQRAIDLKTSLGRQILAHIWPAEEAAMLNRLWHAGVHVPYPVGPTDDGVMMQYLGDRTGAAPTLAAARLSTQQAHCAARQLVADLHRMVAAGIVHADLSPYNILWWEEQAWIIDLPQAVDLAANLDALDFLLRDLRNVGQWFRRHGVAFDPDDVFADLLSSAFG